MPRAICLLPRRGAALLAVNILSDRIGLLPLQGATLLAVNILTDRICLLPRRGAALLAVNFHAHNKLIDDRKEVSD